MINKLPKEIANMIMRDEAELIIFLFKALPWVTVGFFLGRL